MRYLLRFWFAFALSQMLSFGCSEGEDRCDVGAFELQPEDPYRWRVALGQPGRPALVVCQGPQIARTWRRKCCAVFGLPVKTAIVLRRRPDDRGATFAYAK